jgi:hypothetical protein
LDEPAVHSCPGDIWPDAPLGPVGGSASPPNFRGDADPSSAFVHVLEGNGSLCPACFNPQATGLHCSLGSAQVGSCERPALCAPSGAVQTRLCGASWKSCSPIRGARQSGRLQATVCPLLAFVSLVCQGAGPAPRGKLGRRPWRHLARCPPGARGWVRIALEIQGRCGPFLSLRACTGGQRVLVPRMFQSAGNGAAS